MSDITKVKSYISCHLYVDSGVHVLEIMEIEIQHMAQPFFMVEFVQVTLPGANETNSKSHARYLKASS